MLTPSALRIHIHTHVFSAGNACGALSEYGYHIGLEYFRTCCAKGSNLNTESVNQQLRRSVDFVLNIASFFFKYMTSVWRNSL